MPVVLVLDDGTIHASKLTRAALADCALWLTVEWLPKYARELNDIVPSWKTLKQTELAHQTFADADELERAICKAVQKTAVQCGNALWK
ncbi:transposase [Nitratireductor sp. XY-223]|uniref:transposase n=1 Tax=Hyphomicrobiales TaxID=356 RepID=UPI0010AA54CD|nr:transposase [Nitratireductor sp. XY-223]